MQEKRYTFVMNTDADGSSAFLFIAREGSLVEIQGILYFRKKV